MSLNRFVLDASAAVKLVIDEIGYSAMMNLYHKCEYLYAPTLVKYEIANALYNKCRYEGLAENDMHSNIHDFLNLKKIYIIEEDQITDATIMAHEIRHDSIYDLTYCALAIAHGLPLVTYDQNLIKRISASRYTTMISFLTPAD